MIDSTDIDISNATKTMTCDACGWSWHITKAQFIWYDVSGETWHCPFCGKTWQRTEGSMPKARAAFCEILEAARIARFCGEWRRKHHDAERASNAALRGVITKLKAKLRGQTRRK